MGMPIFSIILRKRSRSSARSMTLTGVPRMRTPAAASSPAMFSGVWPPNCTMTPSRLLLLVNAQHVFHGERFEVELVGDVVVGGDGLRVAVDHDRLEARVAQREGRVHAAVVELDPLPDAVGTAAEHHHLARVGACRGPVGGVVGGIVVSRVVDAAHRHGVPCLHHSQPGPLRADGGFLQRQQTWPDSGRRSRPAWRA